MDVVKEFFRVPHNGLGRWPFHDPRDGKYLMRSILTRERLVLPDYKVWKHGIILNQGTEGACVGFGWTAWDNCAPIGQRVQQGNDYAFDWYHSAQEVDPWPGVNYEGTTVRAGARIAIQKLLLDAYVWAGSRQEIDAWLLTRGPIVIGSDWLHSMDVVDSQGFITFDPTSRIRGGHCYLLIGRGQSGNYVFQNSWGENYANDGLFRMRPYDFDKLVSMGNAEFCTAAQIAPAA